MSVHADDVMLRVPSSSSGQTSPFENLGKASRIYSSKPTFSRQLEDPAGAALGASFVLRSGLFVSRRGVEVGKGKRQG